jgi:hypothetical protein
VRRTFSSLFLLPCPADHHAQPPPSNAVLSEHCLITAKRHQPLAPSRGRSHRLWVIHIHASSFWLPLRVSACAPPCALYIFIRALSITVVSAISSYSSCTFFRAFQEDSTTSLTTLGTSSWRTVILNGFEALASVFWCACLST